MIRGRFYLALELWSQCRIRHVGVIHLLQISFSWSKREKRQLNCYKFYNIYIYVVLYILCIFICCIIYTRWCGASAAPLVPLLDSCSSDANIFMDTTYLGGPQIRVDLEFGLRQGPRIRADLEFGLRQGRSEKTSAIGGPRFWFESKRVWEDLKIGTNSSAVLTHCEIDLLCRVGGTKTQMLVC